jgi:hypothetical protein
MKTLASNTMTLQQNIMSFQQETRSSIHNLEKQMGQVASSVGKLEEKRSKQIEMEEEEEIETKLSIKKEHPPPPQTETLTNTPKVTPHSMNSSFKTISPFPVSSSRSKKEDKEKEILEVFKKVELNIPKHVYDSLSLEPLNKTSIVIQLADRSFYRRCPS